MSAGTSRLQNRIAVRGRAADGTRPRPGWTTAKVVAHEVDGARYRRLTFEAPEISERALAGQFVMVTIPETVPGAPVLPRPMAIHRRRIAQGQIDIIYGVVGAGTQALARVKVGAEVLLTGPLGTGFDVGTGSVLTLSRGIGTCAIMGAIEDAQGRATAVLSARNPAEVIGLAEVQELGGIPWAVTDSDGSSEVFRLEQALREAFDATPPGVILVCGSDRLIELAGRLSETWGTPVQLSVEAHMACGLGYCHGCAIPDGASEGPLVCVDGPVFDLVT